MSNIKQELEMKLPSQTKMQPTVKIYCRISAFVLHYLEQFCLYDRIKERHHVIESKPEVELQDCRKFSRWPEIVAFLNVYTILRVLVLAVLQYNHDLDYIRLIRAKNQTDPYLSRDLTSSRLSMPKRNFTEIELEYSASNRMLKLWGNPYPSAHLLLCACIFAAVIIGISTYASSLVSKMIGTSGPYDNYFLTLVLDKEAEIARCRQIIESSANQFKASSKWFILNWRQQLRTIARTLPRRRSSDRGINQSTSLEADSEIKRQTQISAYLVAEFDRIAASDELLPINRSAEWLDEMSRSFATFFIGNIVYSILFDFILIYWLPQHAGALELATWSDIVMLSEIVTLFAFSVLSTTFYLGIIMTTCQDQIRYLTWLHSRLVQCIETNDHVFAAKQAYGLELSKVLNKNLSRALLEFEVYRRQLKPIQESFSFLLTVSVLMIGSVLVGMRLHMSYLEMKIFSFTVYFGVVCIAWGDSIVIPMAQIHNSSKKLHVVMSRLLAQSIELDLKAEAENGVAVYSAYLVWYQRSLVEDSHRFGENFAAHAFNKSLDMTWRGVIKIHYYYSVVMISLVYELKTIKSIFGYRLKDPLCLHERWS